MNSDRIVFIIQLFLPSCIRSGRKKTLLFRDSFHVVIPERYSVPLRPAQNIVKFTKLKLAKLICETNRNDIQFFFKPPEEIVGRC